jgi:hypothetical protein
MASTTRKILLSALVLALFGSVAGFGVFSAFSVTTVNSGNAFAAGTVTIGDNDAGSALYNVSNRKPGDSVTSCIRVTYSGTLASDVKLYTADPIGAIGPYVNLTIDAGSQPAAVFPSCAGFTPDAGGPIFNGTLAGFSAAHNSYVNGLLDYPGTVATSWSPSDVVVYRFTVSLQDNNAAAGLASGSHAFTWEARNQ